jgi:glycosyltransferase involved in cell wall biosynthesis
VVIVVSKDDFELGQKMPNIGEKMRYIPIGIDTPSFLSKDAALENVWKMVSREKVPEGAMRILIIAELTPNKGVQYALEAMMDLRRDVSDNFVCVIMGDGEERSELEKFVRLRRLEDKVFFLGFVADAYLYMRAFDVFLLPSIKEGMPYVLLEAGESGIPVVATDVVNPEIKERYQNVRTIRAGNGFAIADAIRKVKESLGVPPPPSTFLRFPLSTMVEQTLEQYGKI